MPPAPTAFERWSRIGALLVARPIISISVAVTAFSGSILRCSRPPIWPPLAIVRLDHAETLRMLERCYCEDPKVCRQRHARTRRPSSPIAALLNR